jgi:cytochrome c
MKLLNHALPILFATLPLCAWVTPVHAADAAHGASVFEAECAECHSVKPGKNRKGPSLFGVAGRSAASVPDYVYSEALKNSGLSWTADRLDAYIIAPRKLVPGCKMQYDGLEDAAARADLIEFLNNTH